MRSTIERVKTSVLADLVKPVPCNKCGEPVYIGANTGKSSLKLRFTPYDVVASPEHPGMAIPLYSKYHFDSCVIAVLEAKREARKVAGSESTGKVKVRATISDGKETKSLTVRSESSQKASELLRATIAKNYAGFQIVGWATELTD